MAATRRLAAVMFTDIVGYTSLAQKDEAGALQLLQEQDELVRPLFLTYHGRQVKSTGDGLLVEFDSAREASQCAVEIQQRMHERNAQKDVTPLHLRIGIHLGDVEQRGSDIFGDAVNIASRIEPVAEPGGVCLSPQVYDQIRNKVPFKLEKLGPRTLKGLEGPIDIYRVVLPWQSAGAEAPSSGSNRLAVLPFANISPDPKDEYFAEGLTEELITVLSQLHELRVIARTSVMRYKSAPKPVSEIGAELGVDSVLEGSVRKAGDHLRITVQLIDVRSQEHTWAETYDRKLEDVFAIQTEVARRIAKTLKVRVRKAEKARLEERPTVLPDSYLAYLKGRSLLSSSWAEGSFRAAKKQFELAISIDPTNARAHSGLADATAYLGWLGSEGPPAEWKRVRKTHATRAIELDPGLAEAHCSLAEALVDNFEYFSAEKEFKLALSLNPSYSLAHHWYAELLEEMARPDEALRECALADESDPNSMLTVAGHAQLLIMLRKLDEAETKVQRLRELVRAGADYYTILAFYYYARSDYPRALQAADRKEELAPGESWREHTWIYAASGEKEKARKLVEEQERKSKRPPAAELAVVHAVLGDIDECFRLLDQAWEERKLPLQFWRNEPTFEPVRKDPRFAQLLKRMNLA